MGTLSLAVLEVSPSPVYGARLLSGLRVIPSRGFKSRRLRQCSRAPPPATRCRTVGPVAHRSPAARPGLQECALQLSESSPLCHVASRALRMGANSRPDLSRGGCAADEDDAESGS